MRRRINLVQNGIFPLKDQTEVDSTGYNLNGTFQGEGKLIGTPCMFIRTSGCNLRCSWVGVDGKGSPCDTPYSSHNPERNMMFVDEVAQITIDACKEQGINYVVVSGGEPTIQDKALPELLKLLQDAGLHTTIETNGTNFNEEIAKYTNLVSMSPKLSTSTPWQRNLKDTGINFNLKWAERHERDRINIEAIQQYINSCWQGNSIKKRRQYKDFQMKFVVSTIDDIEEIERDFLNLLIGWSPDDICLMPEGVTSEHLMERTGWIAQEALRRGWRFTPRLHIMMFGKARYV